MKPLPAALSPGMIVQRGRQALAIYGLLQRTFGDAQKPPPSPHIQPVKVHLVDTVSAEDVEVQFNPTELTRSLGVSYGTHDVAGLSYQPMNYQHTGNQALRLQLTMRALGQTGRKELAQKARFFESLAYPRALNGRSAAPPPVLLLWPGYLSIVCVVDGWEEVATAFCSETMEPIQMVCNMTLTESRRRMLTSSDVRAKGGQRWRQV